MEVSTDLPLSIAVDGSAVSQMAGNDFSYPGYPSLTDYMLFRQQICVKCREIRISLRHIFHNIHREYHRYRLFSVKFGGKKYQIQQLAGLRAIIVPWSQSLSDWPDYAGVAISPKALILAFASLSILTLSGKYSPP